jgi:hypothetical protein
MLFDDDRLERAENMLVEALRRAALQLVTDTNGTLWLRDAQTGIMLRCEKLRTPWPYQQ